MIVVFKWEDYIAIWDRALAFQKKEGRLPNYVDDRNYRIMKTDLQAAAANVIAFRKKNFNKNPTTVSIKVTEVSTTNGQPVKTPLLIRIENAIGGTFKTATQFYELVRKNESYKTYYNDVYPQGEALRRLENNLPLNCADFSQIGYAALMELNKVYKTNYHADYLRVGCKPSGVGHIILKVSGGEFYEPVYFDVAEAAAAGKPIGQTMCTYGFNITNVNPDWLLKDDGIT